MYSLSECLRSESNSEPPKWNIRWILLRKLFSGAARQLFCKKLHFRCYTEFEYHSADSKLLLTFSKSQAVELFAN